MEKCVLFASPVIINFLPVILEEDAEFNSRDQSEGRPVCRIASKTFGFNSHDFGTDTRYECSTGYTGHKYFWDFSKP